MNTCDLHTSRNSVLHLVLGRSPSAKPVPGLSSYAVSALCGVNEPGSAKLWAGEEELPKAYITLKGTKPPTAPFSLGTRQGRPLPVTVHGRPVSTVGRDHPVGSGAGRQETQLLCLPLHNQCPRKPLPSARFLGTRSRHIPLLAAVTVEKT